MHEKLVILTDVLGSSYRSGGELLFKCPYCKHHKRKLSVNVEKGVYKCWICDARGTKLSRIVRRFGTFNDYQAWKDISGEKTNLSDFDSIFEEKIEVKEKQIIEMPESFVSLCNHNPSKVATRYLKTRDIEKPDILKWKMGYCTKGRYKDRIIIPSFDMQGNLNYFIARTFTDQYMRYLNPPAGRDIIFNELYLDFEKEITLVEGVFDAIKAENAVPLLGSTLRESSNLFKKIVKFDTPVLLALDPDAERKSTYIKNLLLKYGIEVRELQYPDDRDLGEMSKEEVRILSTEAPFIREYDTLLSAISSL